MSTPILTLEAVSKRFTKPLDAASKFANLLGAKYSEQTVHAVDSVDGALDFLLRREAFAEAARPDVVLLDLNLPRRHGLDLLDEMRGHDTIAGIPVIVLTSSASEEDRRRSYASAATAFVTKPQSLDAYVDLLHVVATWASQQPKQEPLP